MQEFQRLAQALRKTASTHKGVVEIHPHVWQIALDAGLGFLSACVADKEISSRVVFLTEKPEWIHNQKASA